MSELKLTISIDFDGTICTLRYPFIGELMEGARETINELVFQGHTIIINTCRSGEHADNARKFLEDNGVNFHFFNENDPEIIAKYGRDTRKISADLYIDDKNLCGFSGWKSTYQTIQNFIHQKPIIVCVVGESGSGKTTLVEGIEKDLGVNLIQSYTDRPRRKPNENGHTFVSPEEFDAFKTEDMLAYTKFGDYRYCCLKTDLKRINTYVIDEVGFKMLDREAYDIYSVRVICNELERVRRVGEARVSRDRGRFNIPFQEFNWLYRTDEEYSEYKDILSRVRILKNRYVVL